jgi:hypothetical protein
MMGSDKRANDPAVSDQLTERRYRWVRVSSVIAMVAVSTYLAAVRNWDWYFWAPIGIVVYLASRALWGFLLGILDQSRFKRESPHLHRQTNERDTI